MIPFTTATEVAAEIERRVGAISIANFVVRAA